MVHPLVALLIYLLGLALLFLELFIPSGGILGIAGSLCTIYGIIEIFGANAWIGVAVVIVTVGYVYMILKFWARRVTMSRTLAGSDSHTPEASPIDLVGAEGVTQTVLRPAGFAVFNGQRFQVVTQGGFLSQHQKIRVVEVVGNRIVVTAVEEPKDEAEEDDVL